MICLLVGELAAGGIVVTLICRVLGFSTQGFYRWTAGPVTVRYWVDAHLINAGLEIHSGAAEVGYRLVAAELPEHGIRAGENRVQRLWVCGPGDIPAGGRLLVRESESGFFPCCLGARLGLLP